jgi:hypothetical protein
VLIAIAITVLTTVVLLLVEPGLSKAEAIKTGGLAGGAVVALYALWLNDRRRRTDEARHELESDKAADERFARSVELLGNEADQVRVGRSTHWHGSLTPLRGTSRPCSTCFAPIYADPSHTPAMQGAQMTRTR